MQSTTENEIIKNIFSHFFVFFCAKVVLSADSAVEPDASYLASFFTNGLHYIPGKVCVTGMKKKAGLWKSPKPLMTSSQVWGKDSPTHQYNKQTCSLLNNLFNNEYGVRERK